MIDYKMLPISPGQAYGIFETCFTLNFSNTTGYDFWKISGSRNWFEDHLISPGFTEESLTIYISRKITDPLFDTINSFSVSGDNT